LKSFRLGGGEFEHNAATVILPLRPVSADLAEHQPLVFHLEKASIVDARGRFLAAVAQVEPEVLRSLGGAPLVALNELDASPNFFIFEWSLVEVSQSLRMLRSALLEWSRRWNLNETWCLDWAVQTLSWWRLRPCDEQTEWHYDPLSGNPLPEAFQIPTFELRLRAWDPKAMARADFETQVQCIIKRALAKYLDEVVEIADMSGLVRTPERRDLEAFYWLARRQLKGESPADIARGSDIDGCWSSDGTTKSERRTRDASRAVTVQRVKKAISRLAKFIGLTLASKI
jgi:hypothetical protein